MSKLARGGDDRDGDADAQFLPQPRQGDVDELLPRAGAIEPRRLVERGIDLGDAGDQHMVQRPSSTQAPIRPTAGKAKVKSPSQPRARSPRPMPRSA